MIRGERSSCVYAGVFAPSGRPDSGRPERPEDFDAAAALGHPIAYHRATVAERRVDVSGEIRCSRDDFPWVFAALLDFSGLTFSGSPSPTHPVAFIVDDGAARSVIALPRPKLSSASLGERPAHYAPLYTTVFTLERTDARALLATLQQALDPTRESARDLGDGDTLVVTASYASLVAVGAIVDAAEGGDD